jgi:hypothetical protein
MTLVQEDPAMYPHQRNPRYHDPQVGHWLLPLALGVPAGALGGYFYRRWQEGHPGKYIPWISGEVDGDGDEDVKSALAEQLEALAQQVSQTYGTPLDQTRAKIAESLRSVGISAAEFDALAQQVSQSYGMPFDSARGQIAAIMRDMGIRVGAWQSIVGGEPWESIVGGPWVDIVGGEPWQSIVGGPWVDIVGGEPWVSIVGQALDVLRRQAQVAAREMPGRVIGIIRDANNQWALKSFRDADSADDWFGRVTRDKSRFTYAAYFDKNDPMFPHPLNEEIGSAHAPAVPPSPIPRVVAEVP